MNKNASSSGKFINTGNGASLNILDIGHQDYFAVIEPDLAFWSLIPKEHPELIFEKNSVKNTLSLHGPVMQDEMDILRFKLKPSCVYFNPTEQCNLNCPYCYIPESIRKDGKSMSFEKMEEAIIKLKEYFSKSLSDTRKPELIFHGSEPLVNKTNVFKIIEKYKGDFNFGIQTNGTLLDDADIEFIKHHNVVIGISLDGHKEEIADLSRYNWNGESIFNKVINVLEAFKGYKKFSVITTVTNYNVNVLSSIIDFLHEHHVESCLLNQIRCTLPGAGKIKPEDSVMAEQFIKALDRSNELFEETGRKIIVVNFANIILSIIAPTARKLMCDISPCGGGRSFFAVSAEGGMYPCSEFIGLPKFNGGNLFEDDIDKILVSDSFNLVTGRKVEDINPCNKCAIRHFCGSPCPAEAHEMNSSMKEPGAFCEFYEQQVRYAFRLIADKKEEEYLWENWDGDTANMF